MRDLSQRLLAWYDRHARILPWRVPPGQGQADPYRVWLSEIMLQQTTVAAVKEYFERFTALWPTIHDLATADDARVMAEWAGLGYYARARNLLSCARAVAAAGGSFPADKDALQALPGVGPYTSAAIAAIAFDQPETVVDGNVERVVSRLFAVQAPLPAAKPELRRIAATLTPDKRPGDFAQAMMDLGATVCTPRNPACVICPLTDFCRAREEGISAELPRRAPKAAKPQREGVAWVAFNENAVLLERRPPKGLLGGTLAFPSSGWDGNTPPPPLNADWQDIGAISHIFTHFGLEMRVLLAHTQTKPSRGEWLPRAEFSSRDLPGLMRKVWKRAETEING